MACADTSIIPAGSWGRVAALRGLRRSLQGPCALQSGFFDHILRNFQEYLTISGAHAVEFFQYLRFAIIVAVEVGRWKIQRSGDLDHGGGIGRVLVFFVLVHTGTRRPWVYPGFDAQPLLGDACLGARSLQAFAENTH